MVCLDTAFLADLSRKSPAAGAKFRQLREAGETLLTTIVNIAELYRGAYGHAKVDEKLRVVEETLGFLAILDLNLPAAQLYGQLGAALRARGQTVSDRDLFTAAIALAHGESRIVTRDVRDFARIPGIEVVSY